ncbi:MAG: hypothetical protein IPK19_36345 [Chloroflexi bacterium]|nr:hypothetical protein [Chloroflexota bacterium]
MHAPKLLIRASLFTGIACIALGALAQGLTAPPLPTLEPFTDTACLECHTDEAKLRELAQEDAPAEAESEGPG